jgi:DNA-binding Xre family transcriptional regulator
MLAERVGMTPSTISQLEKGKQGFTNSTLEAFAWALNCNPGDLLMRDPTKPNNIWTIQEQLMKATPEQQHQISDFIEFVLKGNAA